MPARLILLLLLAATLPAHADEPRQVSFPAAVELDRASFELTGWLYRPSGPGPFPAVVLLHGCSGLHDREGRLTRGYVYRANLLRDLGYVVLLPDSFGPRGYGSICALRPRPVLPGRDRVHDAYAAARFLAARSDIAADRIAVVGYSNGGSTVLAALQRPPANLPRFRAAIAFYPGCRSQASRNPPYAPYAPLLILIGEADDWTPAAPCIELAQRADQSQTPLSVVTYPDAHHSFDSIGSPLRRREGVSNANSPTGRGATVGEHPAAREDANARMRAFLTRHLAPDH